MTAVGRVLLLAPALLTFRRLIMPTIHKVLRDGTRLAAEYMLCGTCRAEVRTASLTEAGDNTLLCVACWTAAGK